MKRFCLNIVVLLLAVLPLAGQNVEEIENATFMVDNLLEKAARATRANEQQQLATQAMNIARGIRYDGGLTRAALLLGRLNMQAGKTEDALQHFLEAEVKAQSMGNKTILIQTYHALGDLFAAEKLYANARRYYHAVLSVDPQNYPAMEKAADACLLDMRFDSAEYFYKELIGKYKKEGDNPRLIQIYQKLANAYNASGNTGKGLYYYLYIEDILDHFGTPVERAMLYNNLGKQYATLFDYNKALEYFRRAELQCSYIPCDNPEVLYANLGVALHNTGKDQEAIEYLLKSEYILVDQRDKVSLASLEHLIARVYLNAKDLYNAINHNNKAINLAAETKQRDVQANAYRTAADLYHELYDFENAYDYYQKYLTLLDSIRLDEQSRRQRIDQQRALLATAEGQIRYLLTRQNIKELELQNSEFERERLALLNKNLALEKDRQENELRLLQQQKEIDQVRQRELILQNLNVRKEQRLALQQLNAEKQNRLIAELRQQEAQRQADSTSRAQEIEILRRDKDLADLQLQQQQSFRRFAYGLGALGLTILGLLLAGWLLARRTGQRLAMQNRKIEAQKELIEEERQKSDRLLLNILPGEIADELRTRGHADPRYYESATVLFTDFLDFTRLSAQLNPEELIGELDECFLAFDEICEKYNLEKIKTIGDAFMCAGGVPIPSDAHPIDAVSAALEMVAWLEHRNLHNPKAIFRQMRIGIHTGPVIAGVIGKNKFAYDIWGDAVNLAARLEELGEPNRINISGSTREAVQDRFVCTYRGKKDVHNKGLIDMYFIDGVKTPEMPHVDQNQLPT